MAANPWEYEGNPLIEGFGWNEQRDEPWVPWGFQVSRPRRHVKQIPDWVFDTHLLHQVLSSHSQYETLGPTWRRVLYLFYNNSLSAREVSEDLGLSLNSVKSVLKKLRKRARTMQSKISAKEQEGLRAAELFSGGKTVREVALLMKISTGKAAGLRIVHFKRPLSDSI